MTILFSFLFMCTYGFFFDMAFVIIIFFFDMAFVTIIPLHYFVCACRLSTGVMTGVARVTCEW